MIEFTLLWVAAGLASCLFLIASTRNAGEPIIDWDAGDWFLFGINFLFGGLSLFIWCQMFVFEIAYPWLREVILKDRKLGLKQD